MQCDVQIKNRPGTWLETDLPQYNEHYFILHCHLLELDDVPVGRLVALGDSEGLIEGSVFVAGTSMLSSVTAGSLSIVSIASASVTERWYIRCAYHFSDN